MNPLSSNKSPTGISLTCTNLSGQGIMVSELADTIFFIILKLKADVHIIVNSWCSDDELCHFLNTSQYKYMMSNYKHIGSKGVIVLYNRNKTKIDDVSIIQEWILLHFWMKIKKGLCKDSGMLCTMDGEKS